MSTEEFPRLEIVDANLLENIVSYVSNVCYHAIVETEKATQSLGEESVKEVILEGIKAVREALDVVSRHLPQDEHTQREYAQRFLEATNDGMEAIVTPEVRQNRALIFDTAEMAGGINGDEGIEEAISPRQMRLVGDEFGAPEVPYTEQDLVNALGWVKTMISDVQTVLLEFDDEDLNELAQMTLISLKIIAGYVKRTHRTLAQLGWTPAQDPSTDGPGDNGAGPSLRDRDDPAWERAFLGEEINNHEENGGLPWEPLAPRLLEEAQRFAVKGKERPLTAAVVLTVAMPFTGVAVFFGAPVLAGDAALQWGARTPVGKAVTQGTQNAVEFGKLGWVAGKLATKQTLRLAGRELERAGGVGGLARRAGEGALWTAGHPIEATMMGAGLAVDTGRAVCNSAVWLGDFLATVREEVFASHPEGESCRQYGD